MDYRIAIMRGAGGVSRLAVKAPRRRAAAQSATWARSSTVARGAVKSRSTTASPRE
jgi:hypothetical protein